jgi:excisionase family DNA binding protein
VSIPLAYTDADVASLLSVSKRTIYRLRKSGVLRSIHVGRAVRIPADSLAQFLERAERDSAGAHREEAARRDSARPALETREERA